MTDFVAIITTHAPNNKNKFGRSKMVPNLVRIKPKKTRTCMNVDWWTYIWLKRFGIGLYGNPTRYHKQEIAWKLEEYLRHHNNYWVCNNCYHLYGLYDDETKLFAYAAKTGTYCLPGNNYRKRFAAAVWLNSFFRLAVTDSIKNQ